MAYDSIALITNEAKRRTAERGLASARGLVQSRIAKGLRLREAPIIRFEFDPSIERAIEVSRLIEQVAAELGDEQADAADAQESEGGGDSDEDGADEDPRADGAS